MGGWVLPAINYMGNCDVAKGMVFRQCSLEKGILWQSKRFWSRIGYHLIVNQDTGQWYEEFRK